MFCPKCGNEVQDGNAFCGKCGASIDQAKATNAGSVATASIAQKAPGDKKGAIIGVALAVAIIAVILIVGFATNWFGLTGSQPDGGGDVQGAVQEQQPEGSDSSTSIEAKASVEAYTWDELSQISAEIAAVGDEAAGIEVAKKYNLCTPDGKLDGTQVKSVTLTDGTQTTVQIIGFNHDDKTSGGKAGITFIFGDAIADYGMNSSDTSEGSWEKSDMRAWLASKGKEMLPSDLQNSLVAVDKWTSSIGFTNSDQLEQIYELGESLVTSTSDEIWLFSPSELVSVTDESTFFNDIKSMQLAAGTYSEDAKNKIEILCKIYNAQGSEYKLFRDCSVQVSDNSQNNPILIKDQQGKSSSLYKGKPISWWERTPCLEGEINSFHLVTNSGDPLSYQAAGLSQGVVPGFCI